LPIADWPSAKHQSEIGNRQLAIGGPTRYRKVKSTTRPSPDFFVAANTTCLRAATIARGKYVIRAPVIPARLATNKHSYLSDRLVLKISAQ